MNIIVRGALWGVGISLPFGVGVGVFACYLQGPDNPITLHAAVTTFATLAAFVGAMLGAGIGSIAGAIIRSSRKQPIPAMQYDAPQEGIWPPPPIVPADAESKNT